MCLAIEDTPPAPVPPEPGEDAEGSTNGISQANELQEDLDRMLSAFEAERAEAEACYEEEEGDFGHEWDPGPATVRERGGRGARGAHEPRAGMPFLRGVCVQA